MKTKIETLTAAEFYKIARTAAEIYCASVSCESLPREHKKGKKKSFKMEMSNTFRFSARVGATTYQYDERCWYDEESKMMNDLGLDWPPYGVKLIPA